MYCEQHRGYTIIPIHPTMVNSKRFVKYSDEQSLTGLTNELYYKLDSNDPRIFDEAKLECEAIGGALAFCMCS